MRHFIIALGIAVASTALPAYAQTASAPKTVIAKAGTNALILVDATSQVADIARNHVPHDQAMTQLEGIALQAMRDESAKLPHSSTITARLLYDKVAEVNPAYGVATYSGAEKVFDMTAQRTELAAHYDAYAKQIAGGTVPSELKLTVTGVLP